MGITYKEKLPTAEEYIKLRTSVSWGTYGMEVIEKSLPMSLYSICVYDGQEIIGMGRVVGDAVLCFYIQDIIIVPEYQKKGYGTQIMNRVMVFITEHAVKNSVIALMAAKGKEEFYKKFGFKSRPSNIYGHGMHLLKIDD